MAVTIKSSTDYTLGSGQDNLTLTGKAAINGTGNDTANFLLGNSAANILTGEDGDDTITGAGGVDTLIGGDGDDTYVVNIIGTGLLEDSITENDGEGDNDTLQLKGSLKLTTYSTITLDDELAYLEHLDISATGSTKLNLTGNNADNHLTGNAGANVLLGEDGDDTLDGGAGSDTMSGGEGSDTYYVNTAGDVIQDDGSASDTDLVYSTASYTLSDGLENLTLLGKSGIHATGNSSRNILTGNNGANRLDGGDGDDTLLGGLGADTLTGGLGSDSMEGGAGNDTYEVDDEGDIVTEESKGGTDLVKASISYALGDYVEKLTLTGSDSIDGEGNSLNNTILGNSAANVLTGGDGYDTLKGGDGDDTYVVNLIETGLASSARAKMEDIVTEGKNQGADTIKLVLPNAITSSYYSTITLGANIENVDASETGSVLLSFVGNGLANIITGNDAANYINAYAGNDTIYGGAGDDVILGDKGNDVIDGGDGDDDLYAGDGDDSVTGGDGDDTLSSSYGSDTLEGGDGDDRLYDYQGVDTLVGGDGDDTYIVIIKAVSGVATLEDTVIENADEGDDTLLLYVPSGTLKLSTATEFTLADGILANFENLDARYTGNTLLNLTGNSRDNILIGNAAANHIDGGDGSDTVKYTSATKAVIANLATGVVTGGAGNDTLTSIENIYGSDYKDQLTGNDEDNLLVGGSGADTLIGGLGNDTYNVDIKLSGKGSAATVVLNDTITENAGEGDSDSLQLTGYLYVDSFTTISLSGDLANFENLDISDTNYSSYYGTKINLVGNAADNILTGNAANNNIAGGAGNDKLTGGYGADYFVFDTLISDSTEAEANADTITDFVSGLDKIKLDSDIFSTLPDSYTESGYFESMDTLGTPSTADIRLIFDTSTHKLYYDADGNGSGEALLLATLSNSATLTENDFTW
ncbi:beta strand repeat-containing protein [Methylovorus glucosotrophus]|uniref:Hemolysin-type calcium-binding region n=1 Tax=Methylovorus glucosotrophus (strain SIP3-4) TaxID=582744 RepID=C6XC35_METGS|nr:calcium-binding protein [Methylovorus glucosotrophus]ACT50110.1 Hemolysin-type calcium-binding region [Methylovorus glucosotrophus SIP3-4]